MTALMSKTLQNHRDFILGMSARHFARVNRKVVFEPMQNNAHLRLGSGSILSNASPLIPRQCDLTATANSATTQNNRSMPISAVVMALDFSRLPS